MTFLLQLVLAERTYKASLIRLVDGPGVNIRVQAKTIIVGATLTYKFSEWRVPDFADLKWELKILISVLYTLSLRVGLIVIVIFNLLKFFQ